MNIKIEKCVTLGCLNPARFAHSRCEACSQINAPCNKKCQDCENSVKHPDNIHCELCIMNFANPKCSQCGAGGHDVILHKRRYAYKRNSEWLCELCMAAMELPIPSKEVTEELHKAMPCKVCLQHVDSIRGCKCTQEKPAVRDDSNKARYDLLPAFPLFELVNVLTYGATKYAPRNWEKGLAYSRCFASLMRHAWAFWRGENNDPETGLHHMAHVACNAFFLMEYVYKGTGEDDRVKYAKWKPGISAEAKAAFMADLKQRGIE